MRFSWNTGNVDHIAAHGVMPSEAEQVFQDQRALFRTANAPRRAIIGRTQSGRVLVVIYERYRTGTIRVVTAYDAGERDRRAYMQQS